jgi:hypothetical protein
MKNRKSQRGSSDFTVMMLVVIALGSCAIIAILIFGTKEHESRTAMFKPDVMSMKWAADMGIKAKKAVCVPYEELTGLAAKCSISYEPFEGRIDLVPVTCKENLGCYMDKK